MKHQAKIKKPRLLKDPADPPSKETLGNALLKFQVQKSKNQTASN